mgnify:CR=1 FL=1
MRRCRRQRRRGRRRRRQLAMNPWKRRRTASNAPSSMKRIRQRRSSAFGNRRERCARSAGGRAHRPRPAARTTEAGDRPGVFTPPVAQLLKRSFSCLTCSASRQRLQVRRAVELQQHFRARAAIRAARSRPARSAQRTRPRRRRPRVPPAQHRGARSSSVSDAAGRAGQRRPAGERRLLATPCRLQWPRTARDWSSSSHRRSFAASVCHTAASRDRLRVESIVSTAAFAFRKRASMSDDGRPRGRCAASTAPAHRAARGEPRHRPCRSHAASCSSAHDILLRRSCHGGVRRFLRLARRSSSSLRFAWRAVKTASHAARKSPTARARRAARAARALASACHLAWIAFTCAGVSRSIACAASAVGLRDQRFASRLRAGRARRTSASRSGRSAAFNRASSFFHAPGSTLPRSPSRQRLVGLAQPALDRAAVARLGEQRRNMRRGRGDEFVALPARLLALRGHFGEVTRRRRIRPLARAVEAFPDAPSARPHAARRALSIRCAASALRRRAGPAPCRARASASARSQSCCRAWRWPNDSQRSSSVSCCTRRPNRWTVGFGSTPAAALAVRISSRGRARRLQLSGGERLLRGVQQARAHACRASARHLLRRLNLRQPALLDHDQRGLEALRERGCARSSRSSALQRSGRFAWSIDVPAASCLGFDDERFGAGQRVRFALPAGDAPLRVSSSIETRPRRAWLCAMSRNAASSSALQRRTLRASVGGCSASSHSRKPALELRARAAARRCSRSNRACTTLRAASQRARRASSPARSSACQRWSMSTIALTIGPGFAASASSCVEQRVGRLLRLSRVRRWRRDAAGRAARRRDPCSSRRRRSCAALRACALARPLPGAFRRARPSAQARPATPRRG